MSEKGSESPQRGVTVESPCEDQEPNSGPLQEQQVNTEPPTLETLYLTFRI